MSKLSIIMYHYVRPIRDSKYPKIKGLELEKFKRQLDYLEDNFQMIRAEDLVQFATSDEGELPSNGCLLTFDDGYKDHIDYVAPELIRRGIQGSFFPPVKSVVERKMLDVNSIHLILATCSDYQLLVRELHELCLEHGVTNEELAGYQDSYFSPSRFDIKEVAYFKTMLQHVLSQDIRSRAIETLFRNYVKCEPGDIVDDLYMNVNDIEKLLESGMYVGSHGYSHGWLNREAKEVQQREIDLSLDFLTQVGASVENWIMCYPYGAYNSDTLQILSERKCAIGLTTKVGLADLTSEMFLELRRFDTNDFPQ